MRQGPGHASTLLGRAHRTGFSMYDVLIVGSGPTGMMLAGELRLAGVEVAILERRTTAELVGSRAGGFHSRTTRDPRPARDRGAVPRRGRIAQAVGFGGTVLDLGDFPTRYPYSLALFQNHIERIMLGWVDELGVPIHRGVEVTGVAQDDDGVDALTAEGTPLRAQYLVGADGGRSVIRRAVGIDFVGEDATRSNLIAEVEVTEEIPAGAQVRPHRRPRHARSWRTVPPSACVTTEPEIGPATEPTLADLSRDADDRLRHRLRRPRPDLDLALQRRHPAGDLLPVRPRADRRRCRARPRTLGRAGHRPRRAGRGQPRLEARASGPRHLARGPAGHLPGRTAPGRPPAF